MVDEVLQGENSLFTAIILSLGIILFLAIGLVLFFFFSRKKIVKAQLEKAELEIRSQRELIQATLLTQARQSVFAATLKDPSQQADGIVSPSVAADV